MLKTLAEGFAFDMQVTVSVEVDGEAVTVPITYSGDSRIVYTAATITAALPDETIESSVLLFDSGLYPAVFGFDTATQEWKLGLGEAERLGSALFFANLTFLLEQDNARYGERQVFGGVETHVTSGTIGRGSGASAEGSSTLRIGVEDGLLLQAEATGSLLAERGVTTAFGNLTSDKASFTVTWDLFDHGKRVPVVLPKLALPTFSHAATALDDGRVLMNGGFTGVANNNVIAPFPLPFTQVYDPVAETWTYAEPLQGYSLLNSTVKLEDGRVLLVGVSQEDETGAASVFDPADDSWELLPEEPALRGAPHLVLLADGRILAIGGLDLESPGFSPDPSDAVEVFDPQAGRWERKGAMPVAFDELSLAALPDGRAIVMGHPERAALYEPDAAWVYDPAPDVWTPLDLTMPSVPADLAFLVQRPGPAILLQDGRLLITGPTGVESDHSLLDTCDAGFPEQVDLLIPDPCNPASTIHDPASGATAFTGPVSHLRTGHTLTLLPDGRVLAAGGIDPGDPFEYSAEQNLIATTEIYDPLTDSWTLGPDLSEPRFEHTATLLPDGRVLLIGGIGQEKEPNPPGSDKEIYPLRHAEVLDLTP
ncbi:MAG: kelch repeat-containing protein [Chloroflexota bacterium]|nr:kelch repeat-containing protein [Chloroflexota bacterium]MDE2884205.1 kelch repeat-containing protein [Chloroflexota bacterium]